MKIKFIVFGCVLFVLAGSCSSPEAKLVRVQRELLALLAQKPVFLVTEGRDSVWLPLPPGVDFTAQVRNAAAEMTQKVKALESKALDATSKNRCRGLSVVLDSLSQPQTPVRISPETFVVNELLRHFISPDKGVRHPALLCKFVECIPDYYEKVYADWPAQAYFASNISPAVYAATDALAQLDLIEKNATGLSAGYRERLSRALPEARWAVKDYVAWAGSQQTLD